MAFNRYTQIIQPSIVNPISFEEFSRVPMAREQARAAGLEAVSSIPTDFYVDNKDLADVTSATDAIEGEKNTLVDKILNDGVNNQTINDFISIKKTRDDKYKSFIDAAQRNKQMIDTWRATIDAQIVNGKIPGWYGQLVKDTEYQKWNGTLKQDGTINTFNMNQGPGYIDVDADIQQLMQQARMNPELAKSFHGGKLRIIPIGYGKIAIKTPDGKDVSSNYESLKAAAELKMKDYFDPNLQTERSKFSNYTGINPQQFADKITDYVRVYSQMDIKYNEGNYSIASDGSEGQNKIPPYPYNPTIPGMQTGIKYKTELPTSFNKFASELATAGDIFTDQVKSEGFFSNLWKTSPFGSFERAKELVNAWQKGKEEVSNKSFNVDKILNQYSNVVKYLNSTGKISNKDIVEANKGNKEVQKDIANEIRDYIQDVSDVNMIPYFSAVDNLRTLFGKSTKNQPEATAKDIAGFINGVDVRTTEDRDKQISDSEKYKLQQALWKAEGIAVGVTPGGSKIVTDSRGNYIPGISQGHIVRLPEDIQKEYGLKPEYIIGRGWEPQDVGEVGQMYNRIQRAEKFINSVPVGIQANMVYQLENPNETDPKKRFTNIPVIYYANPVGQINEQGEVGVVPEVHFVNPDGTTRAEPLQNVIGNLVPIQDIYKKQE